MARDIPITDIVRCLPPVPEDAHKGTFGHLLIAAGSRGFTGAALLAARAAHRTGAGLVTLALPGPLVETLAPALVETMSLPLPATEAITFAESAAAPLLAFAQARDALVIGPGLSRHEAIRPFVTAVLKEYAGPMVIDADALNAIAADPGEALGGNPGPRVLTPHPGEMARLLGSDSKRVQADREACARTFAESHGCVVCLKGKGTIIAAPGEEPVRNTTGNAGMATGGTGDVLSGMVGALLAQGLSPWDAARTGVFVHGLAGDLAVESTTARGLMASDLVDALPAAWRYLEGIA